MALKFISGGAFDEIWISNGDNLQDMKNVAIALGADHSRAKYDVTTVGAEHVQSELGPEENVLMFRVRATMSDDSDNVSSRKLFEQTSMKVAYERRGEAWYCNDMRVEKESDPEDYARTAVKTYTLVPGPDSEKPKRGRALSSSADSDTPVTRTTSTIFVRE